MRPWNDDPFTKRARKENFLARSVYKLEEIDRRKKILSGARLILDLGAAPGSWTQYCLKNAPEARVISVDLSPIEINHPRLTVIVGDAASVDLQATLGNRKVDIVLSDMAPKTSGSSAQDTARSFDLASLALAKAREHLKIGGTLVVKLFMGEDFELFRSQLRSLFSSVELLRPESTRKQSREIFFIAKGFLQQTASP